jgi:hypothetical protein
MGERFIDALLADTLSERYRPSEWSEHMPGQGAVDMIMECFPLEPEQAETCDADSDCLRSPLDRLCDWFAGLFSVDSVAMPID